MFSLFALGGAVGLQTLHANHVAGCFRGVFDAGSPLSAIGDCERTGSGYRVGAVGLQLVSVPFGALGGHFLGRGAALRHDKARNMAPIAGPGGGLLGIGVLSLIATRAVFLTDRYKNRCAHEGVEVCARKNQLLLDTTANLSYAAITFGALMLAYAGAYKRERGRRLGALSPSFGRGYAGLTLQGAF